jgi:hypothetical protein
MFNTVPSERRNRTFPSRYQDHARPDPSRPTDENRDPRSHRHRIRPAQQPSRPGLLLLTHPAPTRFCRGFFCPYRNSKKQSGPQTRDRWRVRTNRTPIPLVVSLYRYFHRADTRSVFVCNLFETEGRRVIATFFGSRQQMVTRTRQTATTPLPTTAVNLVSPLLLEDFPLRCSRIPTCFSSSRTTYSIIRNRKLFVPGF